MRKTVLLLMLFLCFLLLSLVLGRRMLAQFQYSQASELIRKNQFESAIPHLLKAVHFQSSEVENWKTLGYAYLLLSELKPFLETYPIVVMAKTSYEKARNFNPSDADAFFGIAKAESRLEMLHYFLKSGKNPHNPIPFYNKAIALFPNNLAYYLYLADYFAGKQETSLLIETVELMASIAPIASYELLKKKPYWKQDVRDAFKQGLQRVIQEKKYLQTAQKAMSQVMRDGI